MINFISSLPRDLTTGGFSAMNAAAFSSIKQIDRVNYIGPIDPSVSWFEKVVSKMGRVSGLGGGFFYYSSQRLETIATEVNRRTSSSNAVLDFFHGFTPWIHTSPARPYVTWSDCTFHDYIDIYHRRTDFLKSDLDRICKRESIWLKGAQRVMFTSRWAADRAIHQYSLDPHRIGVVGIFGEMEIPETDLYQGSQTFAFVSTNFEAKGGLVVLEAFRQLREAWPEALLVVVGDAPKALTGEPGVSSTGYLKKDRPEDYAKFHSVLSSVRALVHPTRSDISPLVLVEAGYMGCPVISTRRFAIPELVADGTTGFLLDDPSDAEGLIGLMARMLEDNNGYREMRQATWAFSRANHAKDAFEDRLISQVRQVLDLAGMA